MAGSNREITQLRYIDEKGQEQIRINRDKLGDEIYLVKQNNLQNKIHRYYYIDTMKKNDSEFYLSKLDLNVENNEIEIPYNPVLRFAIPVYFDGKQKGIIIVNVFAQKLLDKLLYSQQFYVDIYDQDNHILVSSLGNNWTRYLKTTPQLNIKDFIDTQKLIKAKSGESLFIGLTPKSSHSYYMYLNQNMFILMILMIALSILAAYYLAKVPQRLLRKLAMKEKTIDKYIILSRTNKNGIITDVSEAFCKYSGYSKEELIGNKHNILRHPNTKNKVYEDLWNTIAIEKIWQNQIQHILKNKYESWVNIKIIPEYNENNKLIGYMSIMEDITDKKENIRLLEENSKLLLDQQDSLIIENETLLENEQELLRGLEDFEAFFNSIPTPCIIIANDLNIKFWNQTAEDTFNLKPVLQMEIRPLTVISNLSYIDFIKYLQDLPNKNTSYNIEMYMKDTSLKSFKLHTMKHPIDKDSYILSFNAL